MKATIKEIAKQGKFSLSTVSLALRNSPRVTKETKEKVQSIARGLNYRRNLLGRAFCLQKTDTIGVIVTDITNVLTSKFILSVEAIANSRGYHVIIGNTQGILDKEVEYVNLLSQGKTDGIMIGSVQPNYQHIEELIFHNFPFVLFDKYEDDRVSYVAFDDKKAAYLAVEHLIKLGHRRVGYISGPPMILTSQYKLDGYKQALGYYNLSFDETLVAEGGYAPRDGYNAIQKLLQLEKRPSAIFCFNDKVATGVMKGLEMRGVRVPEDIAIVGFDNSEDEILGLNVPLTTLAFPRYEQVNISIGTLLESIENRDRIRKVVHVDLEPKLIIRESCGAKKRIEEKRAILGNSMIEI